MNFQTRSFLFSAVVLLWICTPAIRAQAPEANADTFPLTTYSAKIRVALTSVSNGQTLSDLEIQQIVDVRSNQTGFFTFLSGYTSYRSFLQTAEQFIADRQTGADASSAGSTSLVSKASVPEVLGLAVSGGALSQSTSGTTTTFTGNALGISRFIRGREVFPYCPFKESCENGIEKFAHRLSGSISMDTTAASNTSAATSGTTTAPSSTTTATSLNGGNWRMSNWSIRYQIPIGRKEGGLDFRKAWDKQFTAGKNVSDTSIGKAASAMVKSLVPLDDLENSADYKKWLTSAVSDIKSLLGRKPIPTPQTVEARLRSHLEDLAKLTLDKKYVSPDQVSDFLSTENMYFAARSDLREVVSSTLPSLSFAYTNSHPLNEANVSNFKLIFQLQATQSKVIPSLTVNAAADIYDSHFSGSSIGRWRDFQSSAQLDWTLPGKFGSAVFSTAGYFQYMAAPAVLQIAAGDTVPGTNIVLPGPAAQLLAPKGNIGIAEAQLTFKLKNGASVPVGVSWASRTELLTGSEVRAHIGLNFNFDPLLQK